jgi:hypothetical protein
MRIATRQRFGFRRHDRVARWSELIEVHWSDLGQMYVTPVAEDQVRIALITSRSGLRFDAVLPSFPQLAVKLERAMLIGSTIRRGFVNRLPAGGCTRYSDARRRANGLRRSTR